MSEMGASYNYPRFKPAFYALDDLPGPAPGQAMPRFELARPDGSPADIAERDGRRLVLETGSVTCPMYRGRIDGMLRLAGAHPETDFMVLYVREAHPGERTGRHESIDEKRANAARLPKAAGEMRSIVVDDLAGTAHRALGSLPNIVYVISPENEVEFRADWNHPVVVAGVLGGSASPRVRASTHLSAMPPSPITLLRAFGTGGLVAIRDFAVGFPSLMRQHAQADREYADSGAGGSS